MSFIFFVLLILIGMFIKKAKWFEIIVILFLGAITYFGNNVADFENYQQAYNYILAGNSYLDLGIGWFWLCKIGSILGLSYLEFKTILIVISTLIINKTIKYFARDDKYTTFFWAVYLIFPALLDCIQIRFFVAETIVLYSLRFLISDKKRDIFKYIIFVLIASTIHSSMLIYLIFLIYKVLGKYENKYIIIISIVMLMFFAFKEQVIKICSIFINAERIQRYFYSTDILGIKGLISYIFTILIFYYLTNIMIKKIRDDKNVEEKDLIFFRFIAKLNILISIVLVFSIFDPNFFRLQRIMWILMYICVLILLNNNIRYINFLGIRMPVKLLFTLLALIGNMIFITLTTPTVIQNLLF